MLTSMSVDATRPRKDKPNPTVPALSHVESDGARSYRRPPNPTAAITKIQPKRSSDLPTQASRHHDRKGMERKNSSAPRIHFNVESATVGRFVEVDSHCVKPKLPTRASAKAIRPVNPWKKSFVGPPIVWPMPTRADTRRALVSTASGTASAMARIRRDGASRGWTPHQTIVRNSRTCIVVEPLQAGTTSNVAFGVERIVPVRVTGNPIAASMPCARMDEISRSGTAMNALTLSKTMKTTEATAPARIQARRDGAGGEPVGAAAGAVGSIDGYRFSTRARTRSIRSWIALRERSPVVAAALSGCARHAS